MCNFIFTNKYKKLNEEKIKNENKINNENKIEQIYELDCTMYNGKYITSKDNWLRNNTSTGGTTRYKVYPINI